MTGLTSITFRPLSPDQIIGLTVRAGLSGIEWGGDVHLPPGEGAAAKSLSQRTAAAGLSVLSYGSYYRLCQGEDFAPVLESAAALGAPNIRVWAGGLRPGQADDGYRRQAEKELSGICRAAAEQGIAVSLEYHRGTLTETAESAAALLKAVDEKNLFTYWQPNPELSHGENCRELCGVLPWLSKLHVFCWKPDGERRPLSEGCAAWVDYLNLTGKRDCLLEFVRDDSETQLIEDAAELRRWTDGV